MNIHSGEAVYVDDIPSPPRCLHGALICSTKPLARVKGVSFESNHKSTGVVDIISAKDIPKAGANIGAITVLDSEPLFAGDITTFAGDMIAFVVLIFSFFSVLEVLDFPTKCN